MKEAVKLSLKYYDTLSKREELVEKDLEYIRYLQYLYAKLTLEESTDENLEQDKRSIE